MDVYYSPARALRTLCLYGCSEHVESRPHAIKCEKRIVIQNDPLDFWENVLKVAQLEQRYALREEIVEPNRCGGLISTSRC